MLDSNHEAPLIIKARTSTHINSTKSYRIQYDNLIYFLVKFKSSSFLIAVMIALLSFFTKTLPL